MAEGDGDRGPGPPADRERLWDQFDPEAESDPPDEEPAEGSTSEQRSRSGRPGERAPPEETDPDPPAAPPPPTASRNTAALQPLYRARKREFYLLWLFAVLTYGVGDSLTTTMALMEPTVREVNPVVGFVLASSNVAGLFALKLALFVVLIVISAKGAIDRDRLSYYAPPLVAIFLGTFLTVWNLYSIGVL